VGVHLAFVFDLDGSSGFVSLLGVAGEAGGRALPIGLPQPGGAWL